jgi:hypothetical protein
MQSLSQRYCKKHPREWLCDLASEVEAMASAVQSAASSVCTSPRVAFVGEVGMQKLQGVARSAAVPAWHFQAAAAEEDAVTGEEQYHELEAVTAAKAEAAAAVAAAAVAGKSATDPKASRQPGKPATTMSAAAAAAAAAALLLDAAAEALTGAVGVPFNDHTHPASDAGGVPEADFQGLFEAGSTCAGSSGELATAPAAAEAMPDECAAPAAGCASKPLQVRDTLGAAAAKQQPPAPAARALHTAPAAVTVQQAPAASAEAGYEGRSSRSSSNSHLQHSSADEPQPAAEASTYFEAQSEAGSIGSSNASHSSGGSTTFSGLSTAAQRHGFEAVTRARSPRGGVARFTLKSFFGGGSKKNRRQ